MEEVFPATRWPHQRGDSVLIIVAEPLVRKISCALRTETFLTNAVKEPFWAAWFLRRPGPRKSSPPIQFYLIAGISECWKCKAATVLCRFRVVKPIDLSGFPFTRYALSSLIRSPTTYITIRNGCGGAVGALEGYLGVRFNTRVFRVSPLEHCDTGETQAELQDLFGTTMKPVLGFVSRSGRAASARNLVLSSEWTGLMSTLGVTIILNLVRQLDAGFVQKLSF